MGFYYEVGPATAFSTRSVRYMSLLQISLLALLLLFCPAKAETSTAQLDPADFLMPNPKAPSQNTVTPAGETKTPQESKILKINMQHVEHHSSKNAATLKPTHSGSLMTYLLTPSDYLAQFDDKPVSDSSVVLVTNPEISAIRRLWQAEITVGHEKEDTKSKEQLRRAIEQIRSVQVKTAEKHNESAIVVEPLRTSDTEPNKPGPARQTKRTPTHRQTGADPVLTQQPDADTQTQPPEEPQQQTPAGPNTASQTSLPYEAVTQQTLKLLENLLQNPSRTDDPFQLAEILFASGHLNQASIFYKEAFKRISPDQTDTCGDKAWFLFQIGNCLRDHDPENASRSYTRLIEQYPASPWTDLARARNELILWYRKDKPQMLIAESKL